MKSILMNIQIKYSEMGPAERRISALLNKDPGFVLSASITQFAEKADCGAATLVRFAKRFGLKGYRELQLALAQEMAALSSPPEKNSPSDSCYDMYTKRLRDVQVTLQKTRFSITPPGMDAAAKAIMSARRIVIFGLGNSAGTTVDIQHKFLRLGFDAQACFDNYLQIIIASHLGVGDVAIGITHSGLSPDIIEALRLAHSCNATAICVSGNPNCPAKEFADICLFTKSDETDYSVLPLSSRIAQLTIFDAIYSYIVSRPDFDADRIIRKTEVALQSKTR